MAQWLCHDDSTINIVLDIIIIIIIIGRTFTDIIIIIIIIIIFFFLPLVVKIPGVKRKKLKTDVSSLEWSEV